MGILVGHDTIRDISSTGALMINHGTGIITLPVQVLDVEELGFDAVFALV